MRFHFCIICVLSSLWAKCQLDAYRPKVAEFSYEQINDAPITSSSELYGNSSSEVDNDALWKLKLGVPILMDEERLLAVQIKSYRHKFYFDTEDAQDNYEIFNEINRRSVTSSGLGFIYKQDISATGKICFLGGANIKGDRFEWNANSRQFYFGSIYTIQRDPKTRYGFGVIGGSDLGVLSITPVFTYTRQIAPKWVLDMQLPRFVSVRHQLNEKSFLIGKIQGNARRYNLTDLASTQESQSQLTLRKVDLQLSIDYEKEIHDWLWFGISGGYNKNLSYYLAEPGNRSRDALFQLNTRSAPTFKASIFIVPPRKFYQ